MLGVYEAICLITLLERQPLNLYVERSGDGQYIAIRNLLKSGWIAEDDSGRHHLLKTEEDCQIVIDYWFK